MARGPQKNHSSIVQVAAVNRLLHSLPADLQSRLEPDLSTVTLASGDVLVELQSEMQHVYFPTSCLASAVVDFRNGNTIEATLIGTDGFVGVGALFGSATTPQRVIIQVPGEALQMDLNAFWRHLADARFRDALGSYAMKTFRIIGQSTGCVAFHPVEQRLARWLLMVQDAIEQEEFHLTHEFIGVMLGVYRPTVTVALKMLSQAGLVESRRGVIKVTDRHALEEAACECYKAQALRA
jgi:CRP-like cAMP-binding protein